MFVRRYVHRCRRSGVEDFTQSTRVSVLSNTFHVGSGSTYFSVLTYSNLLLVVKDWKVEALAMAVVAT